MDRRTHEEAGDAVVAELNPGHLQPASSENGMIRTSKEPHKPCSLESGAMWLYTFGKETGS